MLLLHHACANIRTQYIASKLSHYFTCHKTSPIFLSFSQTTTNKLQLCTPKKRRQNLPLLTECFEATHFALLTLPPLILNRNFGIGRQTPVLRLRNRQVLRKR